MPKKSIDYNNTIIYRWVCNDLNVKDTYVGSTTDFVRRKWEHKSRCKNEKDAKYNFRIYRIMRENGGTENWSMVEIEKYPCADAREAQARERYWCEQLNAPSMNSQTPSNAPNTMSETYSYSHN